MLTPCQQSIMILESYSCLLMISAVMLTSVTPCGSSSQVTCSCGDLAALLVVPGNGTDGRRRLSR